MVSEPFPEVDSELLNEFFAEADEHLVEIRRCLCGLEPYAESAQVDSTLADALFRSFHSFKGNSALVGLGAAETVAHAAEAYLRQLARGVATLTPRDLELLMLAAQQIEAIVLAFREKRPLPDAAPTLAQLQGLVQVQPAGSDPSVGAASASRLSPKVDLPKLMEEARGKGLIICAAVFVPAKDLDERGVNVNSVRARLGALGPILHALPQVRPGGGIAFEFLVGVREVPPNLRSWEADGVTLTLSAELAGPPRPDPATSEPTASAGPNPFIAPSHFVRVDLSRLDELMRITGEMVIQRARLEECLRRSPEAGSHQTSSHLQEINLALSRALRDLHESLMRVRLVPLAEVFQRMPFVVRDLARETGLKAKLVICGQETEIDKYLIERLKDPLLHLMRNAVSHGIEPAEARVAQNKPAEATLSLSARTVGDSVVIEVGDDGRGIDAEKVARRAAAHGLAIPEPLDEAALLKLICAPGLSTRDQADRASGRGVGMSVVDRTVRELGGTLRLETDWGKGTRFILRLPLTLAITEAFIVTAAGQTFALPQTFVTEVLEMSLADVREVNQRELLHYHQGVLPLVRMTSLLGLPPSARRFLPVLVLRSEGMATGLVVDKVIGQREIVVRSMRDPLVQTPGIAGATELGDGRPVLILDAAAFASGAVMPAARRLGSPALARST